MPSPIEQIEHAERILNEWLVDNTESFFEEQPEIDTARDLLIEALEQLKGKQT